MDTVNPGLNTAALISLSQLKVRCLFEEQHLLSAALKCNTLRGVPCRENEMRHVHCTRSLQLIMQSSIKGII